MKHIYKTAIVLVFAFLCVQSVSAQDTRVRMNANVGSSTVKMEARTKVETSARKVELRTEVKNRVNAMLREKISNLSTAFKKALANLERIASRIESEIAKLKADGKDASASTRALAAARLKIGDAQVAVQALVSVNASSTDPQMTLETLKSGTEAARKAINDAHQSLLEALKALRFDAGVKTRVNNN